MTTGLSAGYEISTDPALVDAICEDPELGAMKRLLLATTDAHGVYADLGFVPLGDPERWMERLGPGR